MLCPHMWTPGLKRLIQILICLQCTITFYISCEPNVFFNMFTLIRNCGSSEAQHLNNHMSSLSFAKLTKLLALNCSSTPYTTQQKCLFSVLVQKENCTSSWELRLIKRSPAGLLLQGRWRGSNHLLIGKLEI